MPQYLGISGHEIRLGHLGRKAREPQRGIESELVISVRPGESFAAHAWLEHEGAALLPPDAPASERLVTL